MSFDKIKELFLFDKYELRITDYLNSVSRNT